MEKKNKMIVIFILCFMTYSLIKNTLKANNTTANMRILSWITILICVIYDFKIILKELKDRI